MDVDTSPTNSKDLGDIMERPSGVVDSCDPQLCSSESEGSQSNFEIRSAAEHTTSSPQPPSKVFNVKGEILPWVQHILSRQGKQTLQWEATEDLTAASPSPPDCDHDDFEKRSLLVNESSTTTLRSHTTNPPSTPKQTAPSAPPFTPTPKINRTIQTTANATELQRTWAIQGDYLWVLRFLNWLPREEAVRKFLPVDWYALYYHVYHAMEYRIGLEREFAFWEREQLRIQSSHGLDLGESIARKRKQMLRFGYQGRGWMGYPFTVGMDIERTRSSGVETTSSEANNLSRSSSSAHSELEHKDKDLGYDCPPSPLDCSTLLHTMRNTMKADRLEHYLTGGKHVQQLSWMMKQSLGIDRLTSVPESELHRVCLDIAQYITKALCDNDFDIHSDPLCLHFKEVFSRPNAPVRNNSRIMSFLRRMYQWAIDAEAREDKLLEHGQKLCRRLGVEDLARDPEEDVYSAMKDMLGIHREDNSWPVNIEDGRPHLSSSTTVYVDHPTSHHSASKAGEAIGTPLRLEHSTTRVIPTANGNGQLRPQLKRNAAVLFDNVTVDAPNSMVCSQVIPKLPDDPSGALTPKQPHEISLSRGEAITSEEWQMDVDDSLNPLASGPSSSLHDSSSLSRSTIEGAKRKRTSDGEPEEERGNFKRIHVDQVPIDPSVKEAGTIEPTGRRQRRGRKVYHLGPPRRSARLAGR
ncbi:hypothetical protein VNI00_014068 [Paramarasmius palmivorus]|uniref:Uncharacterized protein n=1 Tax=Paramarasmius palmivorus TaxID=297713 RepID=A0AAW0BUE6_9AGAR